VRVRRPADHPFQNGSSTLLDGTGSHPENGTRSGRLVALRPRFVPESGPSNRLTRGSQPVAEQWVCTLCSDETDV